MNSPSHRHTNKLINEKSPYLLQHAHNPVDWMPWGNEAFEKAQKENKPIFLSIGYSTCHWCHVMEHESFENQDVADILNRHFISIKVDREERPDVDRVYMTFVQASTGSGGWPMSVFLTPDLKPFYGGTYFPPRDNYGRPGFGTLLQRISQIWKESEPKARQQAEQVINALRSRVEDRSAMPEGLSLQAIADRAAASLVSAFDSRHGGFGIAPKFPRPVNFDFLFRFAHLKSFEKAEARQSLEVALYTLRQMAGGGVNDAVGGGFHRYSVDATWHVPHFEKMLYDQGQLACSYLEAWMITQDDFYATVVRTILDYVIRDMTDPAGGFYSAEDADSLVTSEGQNKAEGAFYVWSEDELRKILPPEILQPFLTHFGIQPDGNAPDGTDPHGEFVGKNILIRIESLKETAERHGLNEDVVEQLLNQGLKILFEARKKRPRPHLDDKIITAWNGLMISGFARAGRVFPSDKYCQVAVKAAQFILDKLTTKDGRLHRSYRQGPAMTEGFADDYAFFIQGLLDLYEATFDVKWLREAERLQSRMDELFSDPQGGYYSVPDGCRDILIRMKEDYDGAEPSPNSIAAVNLLRLSEMLKKESYRNQAHKTVMAFAGHLDDAPSVMPAMVAAGMMLERPFRQVVIVGDEHIKIPEDIHAVIHRRFEPTQVLLRAEGGEGQAYLASTQEYLKNLRSEPGKLTVHVCRNFACQRPATTLEEIRAVINESI